MLKVSLVFVLLTAAAAFAESVSDFELTLMRANTPSKLTRKVI